MGSDYQADTLVGRSVVDTGNDIDGRGRFKRTIGCTKRHPTPHDDTIATASQPSAPSRASPSVASFCGFFMSKVMYSHRSMASLYRHVQEVD